MSGRTIETVTVSITRSSEKIEIKRILTKYRHLLFQRKINLLCIYDFTKEEEDISMALTNKKIRAYIQYIWP